MNAAASLLASLAMVIRPPERMPPSEWAERKVVLRAEQSARPGPYSCGWKPWIRDVHDVVYLEPHKIGFICKKPSQVGITRVALNLMGHACDCDPGPVLYIPDTFDKAKTYSVDQFGPMIESIPSLAAKFAVAAKDRREKMEERPFVGGKVTFAGAGSETGVTSEPRMHIVLDEYEQSWKNFKRATGGDLLEAAFGRVETYKDVAKIYIFGHPGEEGEDIDHLFTTISDMRRWVFDCPHCRGVVEPKSSRVSFGTYAVDLGAGLAAIDEAKINVDDAQFLCPHCVRAISDGDRARATLAVRDGGSGRFETELGAAEAAARPFVGLAINRLADPSVTVREWASRFCRAKSPEARKTFLNKSGETIPKARAILRMSTIAEAISRGVGVTLPGGELGVRFLTSGTDVQSPKDNPTLYTQVRAYTPTGTIFLVAAVKLRGWNEWHEFHRTFYVQTKDGEAVRRLSIKFAGIDSQYETGQVLDNSRVRIYSPETNLAVKYVPLNYESKMSAEPWFRMPSVEKRTNPARPDLGPIDRYYLHRHTVVDREMRLWIEKKVIVALDPRYGPELPPDFRGHMLAQVLRPVKDLHGQEDQQREEWEKPKEMRDDWMQAGAYAGAVAVIEGKLDTLYAMTQVVKSPAPPASAGPRPWMDRGRGGGFKSLWGGR